MSEPLISIVTISYNQGEYLKECLESVASQDFINYEHIVVDDFSHDNSRDIILSFKDKVVPIFKEKNTGAADSLNTGFKKAKGKIYGYINSDDYIIKNCFQNVEKLFNQNKDYDVIYGNGYIVNEKSHFVKTFNSKQFTMKKYYYNRTHIFQQGTFFKKDCFKSVGGFNIDNKTSWDFELFADIYQKKKFKFLKVDDYLAAFRIYPQSMTGSKDKTKSKQRNKYLIMKYFNKKRTLIEFIMIKIFYIKDRLFNIDFLLILIKDFIKSKKKIKII